MKLNKTCTKCMYEHFIENASRLCDEGDFYGALTHVLKDTSEKLDPSLSPSEFFGYLMNSLSGYLGIADLFENEKFEHNRIILEIEEELYTKFMNSSNPLESAIVASVMGNLIDFGVPSYKGDKYVLDMLMGNDIHFDRSGLEKLISELETASTVLITGDNCGEAVLDKIVVRILSQMYPEKKIYYAYRSFPFINDITYKEVVEIGIDKLCIPLDLGCMDGGSNIDSCSDEYRQIFNTADVRIFKGLANLETAKEEDIKSFFLYMAKCKVQADLAKVELGSLVIRKGTLALNK